MQCLLKKLYVQLMKLPKFEVGRDFNAWHKESRYPAASSAGWTLIGCCLLRHVSVHHICNLLAGVDIVLACKSRPRECCEKAPEKSILQLILLSARLQINPTLDNVTTSLSFLCKCECYGCNCCMISATLWVAHQYLK